MNLQIDGWRTCIAVADKKGFTRADGQVIYHYPGVWAADPGFIFQKEKTLPQAVFEKDCVFRIRAVEALEIAGMEYRIVSIGRSISEIPAAARPSLCR